MARISLGSKRFWLENYRAEEVEINGQAATIVRTGSQVFAVVSVDVEQGQVQTIRIIVNSEKLTHV